jgi:hypothetical protein
VRRLRNRLIVAFLAATIVPLFAIIWITTSLLERSLGYATTEELDQLALSIEQTVREFYQRDREALREAVEAGSVAPTRYDVTGIGEWPPSAEEFWNSAEAERFQLGGDHGDRIEFFQRGQSGVSISARSLGSIRMEDISADLRQARDLIETV